MTTVDANNVRIPAAAREALARNEEVVVLRHGRPAYVIVRDDAYRLSRSAPAPRGRKLGEALRILSSAPLPDPEFGDDLEAVLDSVGGPAPDPWERS